MVNVMPLFRRMHVLFVEDDWVIRQILLEHFAKDSNCRAVSFADPAKALSYLRMHCDADRIFSNLAVGGKGGIDLSAGSNWPCQLDLAIAPGYDAEADRFSAIEAGLGFFRIKAHEYFDLWQLVHHNLSYSSYK